MNQATIYIVDDDTSVRRSLVRLCQTKGYKTEAFNSADALLSWGAVAEHGCLILDVKMPGISGMDLQAELKTIAPLLPIIFITGHGDVRMGVTAIKMGAVDFLTKPFDTQELMSAITKALARNQTDRENRDEIAEATAALNNLTPRETEVFWLVIKGITNWEVGSALDIAEKTVKIHRQRVMTKMGVDSLADLVRQSERILGTKPPSAG